MDGTIEIAKCASKNLKQKLRSRKLPLILTKERKKEIMKKKLLKKPLKKYDRLVNYFYKPIKNPGNC